MDSVVGNHTSYEHSRMDRVGGLLTCSSIHMQPGRQRCDMEGTTDWLDTQYLSQCLSM